MADYCLVDAVRMFLASVPSVVEEGGRADVDHSGLLSVSVLLIDKERVLVTWPLLISI